MGAGAERRNQLRLGAEPFPPPRVVANCSRTWTASYWLGWFGSGMYVPKLTSENRGGGTISATSRSAGTTGRRSASAIGEPAALAAAMDSVAVSGRGLLAR